MPYELSKLINPMGIGAAAGGLGMGALSYFGGDEEDPNRSNKAINNALIGALLGGAGGGAYGVWGPKGALQPDTKPPMSTYDTIRGLTQHETLNGAVGGAAAAGIGAKRDANVRNAFKGLGADNKFVPYEQVRAKGTGSPEYTKAVASNQQASGSLQNAAGRAFGLQPEVRRMMHNGLGYPSAAHTNPNLQAAYFNEILGHRAKHTPLGEYVKKMFKWNYKPQTELDLLMQASNRPASLMGRANGLTTRSGALRAGARFGAGFGATALGTGALNAGLESFKDNRYNLPTEAK